jgi:uncharacterized protein
LHAIMIARMNAQPLLVDRDVERRELLALLEGRGPVLALLTGRRRVGKTFLLANLWAADELFLYTAAATTPELNRRQLLTELAAWANAPLRPEDYPSWRTVFRLLVELAEQRARRGERTVFVLDEFQFLGDGEKGLAEVASELNAAWEHDGGPPAGLPLLMALAGSAVATMESLAGGGAPLYGRFAWTHKLGPFDYWHAAQLAPFPSLRERALAFGMVGGTPRYLAALDAAAGIPENAARLVLSPRGEIRMLVETALDQEEGLREVPKYRAILRAVADGRTERNEIAQGAGLSNDNGLRSKLGVLLELGYLEERRNFDARPNEAVRYALADAAVRFHQRFVAPNASILERYPAEQVWEHAVADKLGGYMGLEFERLAVQGYDRRATHLGLPLVRQWSRWEGADRDRRPLEIDLVARTIDGRMLTGAVKWDAAPIGVGVHRGHLDMLRRLAESGRGWAHEALQPDSPLLYIAAGGFSADFRAEVEASGHPSTCWSLGDLYA